MDVLKTSRWERIANNMMSGLSAATVLCILLMCLLTLVWGVAWLYIEMAQSLAREVCG